MQFLQNFDIFLKFQTKNVQKFNSYSFPLYKKIHLHSFYSLHSRLESQISKKNRLKTERTRNFNQNTQQSVYSDQWQRPVSTATADVQSKSAFVYTFSVRLYRAAISCSQLGP